MRHYPATIKDAASPQVWQTECNRWRLAASIGLVGLGFPPLHRSPVMTDRATNCCTDQSMMTRHVAGHAADRSPCQAPGLRACGKSKANHQDRNNPIRSHEITFRIGGAFAKLSGDRKVPKKPTARSFCDYIRFNSSENLI